MNHQDHCYYRRCFYRRHLLEHSVEWRLYCSRLLKDQGISFQKIKKISSLITYLLRIYSFQMSFLLRFWITFSIYIFWKRKYLTHSISEFVLISKLNMWAAFVINTKTIENGIWSALMDTLKCNYTDNVIYCHRWNSVSPLIVWLTLICLATFEHIFWDFFKSKRTMSHYITYYIVLYGITQYNTVITYMQRSSKTNFLSE